MKRNSVLDTSPFNSLSKRGSILSPESSKGPGTFGQGAKEVGVSLRKIKNEVAKSKRGTTMLTQMQGLTPKMDDRTKLSLNTNG